VVLSEEKQEREVGGGEGDIYNPYAIAKTLSAFVRAEVSYDKIFEAGLRSLSHTLSRRKELGNLELNNVILLSAGVCVGGGVSGCSPLSLSVRLHTIYVDIYIYCIYVF
jgi:hypothetical protein